MAARTHIVADAYETLGQVSLTDVSPPVQLASGNDHVARRDRFQLMGVAVSGTRREGEP